MIYSPPARSLKIGPPPCMTTCPLHSTSCYQAAEELLYKRFALFSQSSFTAYKITANIFSCSSSILTEQGIEVSNATVSNGETTYRLPLLLHLPLVTGGNLWPICPSRRCPECFVSDTITVKVGRYSTRSHCVLWCRWSPAKWFILHRWLVLGHTEPATPLQCSVFAGM